MPLPSARLCHEFRRGKGHGLSTGTPRCQFQLPRSVSRGCALIDDGRTTASAIARQRGLSETLRPGVRPTEVSSSGGRRRHPRAWRASFVDMGRSITKQVLAGTVGSETHQHPGQIITVLRAGPYFDAPMQGLPPHVVAGHD